MFKGGHPKVGCHISSVEAKYGNLDYDAHLTLIIASKIGLWVKICYSRWYADLIGAGECDLGVG